MQLNYTYGVEECLRVVDWLQADALVLHLNPLQECVQTRGRSQLSRPVRQKSRRCARPARARDCQRSRQRHFCANGAAAD
ncbi:hypothetical protein [Leptolyngbya sp. O-77]|uniref:hypothetical protein n=1 Tax=Leptolyngbya sp. O-77 TaxID=1080068 RepID=UPI0025702D98|nr:hypothetical protein [Leptolyngbya sp. O-77]